MNILLHDTRVSGIPPTSIKGGLVWNIDKTTRLDLIILTLNLWSQTYNGLGTIKIWAHGYIDSTNEHGGNGVQLGYNDIEVGNVYQWGALNGKVKFIELHACKTADTQPGMERMRTDGNGIYLCSQLAFYSGAIVTASSDTQVFNQGDLHNDMTFGEWEGSVLYFFPNGSYFNSDFSFVTPTYD